MTSPEMPRRHPAPGSLVDLGDVRLWVDDQGDGDPLLLLGGFSAGHFIWVDAPGAVRTSLRRLTVPAG